MRTKIQLLIGALAILDATIAVVAIAFPQLWFTVFHGTLYIDPEGLLRRMGANWAAFAILQAIALAKWERRPELLLLVAGARFGDALTDITYFCFANDLTVFGAVCLLAAGPVNLLAGAYLWRCWFRLKPAAQ